MANSSHIISFDVEEWYHPEAIRTSGATIDKSLKRAAFATHQILDLLKRYQTKATFFVVGEVAAENPTLAERILTDGHELAFHGWTHKPLWVLSPDEFRAEVEQFFAWRDVNFAGAEILGYRAPTFSLDAKTAWALDILQAHGFRYDASIFPATTPLYGVPDAPMRPYRISSDNLLGDANGTLFEIPMSVVSFLGRRIGFTGGLYLRALPWLMTRRLFAHNGQAIVYIHPWETDVHTPHLALSVWKRFILYYGLPMTHKLEKLLQTFDFQPIRDQFAEELS